MLDNILYLPRPAAGWQLGSFVRRSAGGLWKLKHYTEYEKKRQVLAQILLNITIMLF